MNHRQVTLYSSVGGGPMERLCRHLPQAGMDARVQALYSPQGWRRRMAAGRFGRLSARLGAFGLFPFQVLLDSLWNPTTFCVPTTNPFFLPWLLVATRALHGRPVVPLVYDLYPDAFAVGARRLSRGPLRWLATRANRYWFAHSDGLVFIGAAMAAHAMKQYGRPRAFEILPTGADRAEFLPESLGHPQAQSELERWCMGRRVFCYVGNLGLVHDWQTMAQAIPAWLAQIPAEHSVGLVIAASGPGVSDLRNAWAALDDPRIRFESPLPDRAWARFLARASVSLATLRPAAGHTSIPSKTFSAMAAGHAIIAVAPAESDLAMLVQQHGCGRVIAPGDVALLTQTLCELSSSVEPLQSLQQKAREALRDHYDMPQLARRWQGFFKTLGAGHSKPAGFGWLKRATDLLGSGLGLLATAPVLAAAALAIRVSLGSPVLFCQQRPGRAGRPFALYKFRTMRTARPQESGPQSDAQRMTRLGRWLRATSIDELPTLWNVLRGDMALVGPRPLLMSYLSRYSPEQARRHEAKPGITGWAQIHGRNALSWPEKFALDVWYVDHATPWLDLRILAATVGKVFRREGISQAGHATMPEFLGDDREHSA